MDKCNIQLMEEKYDMEKSCLRLTVAACFKGVEYNSRNYQGILHEAFKNGYIVKVEATGEWG